MFCLVESSSTKMCCRLDGHCWLCTGRRRQTLSRWTVHSCLLNRDELCLQLSCSYSALGSHWICFWTSWTHCSLLGSSCERLKSTWDSTLVDDAFEILRSRPWDGVDVPRAHCHCWIGQRQPAIGSSWFLGSSCLAACLTTKGDWRQEPQTLYQQAACH